MSKHTTRAWSLAAGVLRMVAVMGLFSAIVSVGVYGVSGGLAATVPDAEFDYEYDRSAGTLEITHGGVERAAAVRVVGAGNGCDDGWDSGRVTAKDTCALGGSPASGPSGSSGTERVPAEPR
jgi:hypothetical protein